MVGIREEVEERWEQVNERRKTILLLFIYCVYCIVLMLYHAGAERLVYIFSFSAIEMNQNVDAVSEERLSDGHQYA